MPRRTLSGRDVDVDESGFLVDALAWTPEIAEELARESGLARLTPRHWRVVLCCREAAAREGCAPDLCTVSRLAGLLRPSSTGCFADPRPASALESFDSFDSSSVDPDRRPSQTAEVDRCPMPSAEETKGVDR